MAHLSGASALTVTRAAMLGPVGRSKITLPRRSASVSLGSSFVPCRAHGDETTSKGPILQGLAIAAASALLMTPIIASPGLASPPPSVFEGDYSDPKHPGCLRKVESSGKVSGSDGTPGCLDGGPQTLWELQGVIDEDGQRIFIDFEPKGGPKDLVGDWTGSGIRFPDGNTWKKLS